MNRPTWDQYFMEITRATAARSTCDRAIVGAVITVGNRIVSTGFNGAPAGLDHCGSINHLMVNGHCVRTVHAEMNAIIQAALGGTSPLGGTLYVTHFPCFICTKLLINAGITRIVFEHEYRIDENAVKMLQDAMVKVDKFVNGEAITKF